MRCDCHWRGWKTRSLFGVRSSVAACEREPRSHFRSDPSRPVGGLWFVAGVKAADEIILCADGGRRWCHPDGNLDGVPIIDVVLAFGVVTPRVEMTFQSLGKVASMRFANVENSSSATMADDVCARLVTERI